MTLAIAIRRYLSSFVVILLLMAGGAIVSAYILLHERFPNPLQKTYMLYADFNTADSAQGGAGLPVTVAGVQVGTVRTVEPREGVAHIGMAINPDKLPRVYRDARADLVPDTPLKDMEVRISPGRHDEPVIPHGGTIPLASNTAPIDLDDLLAALDSDNRAYLTALLGSADIGTRGRGLDVRQLLKALGPTIQQAKQLGDALVGRRQEIARVVHNFALVAKAAGDKDAQIQTVVSAGDQTLSALADQDQALQTSIEKLPGTISQARSTLTDVASLSDILKPTLTALRPTIDRLPGAIQAAAPVAHKGVPVLRDKLRPLVRNLVPIARDLRPAAKDLVAQTPDLTGSFKVLNYVVNETDYQDASWPGFLYWTAWLAHNGNSITSSADANGTSLRSFIMSSCKSLGAQPAVGVLLQKLLAVNPKSC